MKILHLASEYPPAQVHGLGRFVHGLARAQAALGHSVHVLTNSCGGAQDDVVVDGVHLHRIAFPNPPRPADGHGEVLQFNHGAVARYLDRRDQLQDVDVIVCHDWLCVFAAREIARLLGRPLVATIHDEVTGKRWGVLDPDDRFVQESERLLVHDANLVLANSEYIARQVARHYAPDPARLGVALGGVDPAVVEVSAPERVPAFRSALAEPDQPLVVFVGRIDPEKGLETLAEAIPLVHGERADVRFVIAGTGKLESGLRAQLDGQAQLVGYVKGEALAYLFRAADIVVVPSTYEPLGLVPLEAMLAGAAVVVSDAGGLVEVVRDGQEGRVVPAGDAKALSCALLDLVRQPASRSALAARGQARALQTFAWPAIARATCASYERVLGQPFNPQRQVPASVPRPLVSIVVDALDPVRARAAIGSISRRTGHPFELLVAGPASETLIVESPGARPFADEAAARAAARGDYLCKFDQDAEVPTGGDDWLAGLVWLLEDRGAAEVVSSTVVPGREDLARAPRPARDPAARPPCVLARRVPCPQGVGPAARWEHPVGLLHHGPTTLRATVVVVAYQGFAFTRAALEAVIVCTSAPFELVLVCNGARDGTLDLFRSLRDALAGHIPVQILENAENLGYPIAANQGLRAARARDVVLLNNDTEVRPGWLASLLAARHAMPGTGVVTAKVLNFDGTVQSAGGILHAPDTTFVVPGAGADRLAPSANERRLVDNAGGPCMLVTRELIDAVGLFDEAYSPGYFEDSDLCMRAREAGLALVYEPTAEVFHHAKATSSLVAREGKLDVWGRFEENRARFHERWNARLAEDAAARRPATPEPRRVLLCYHRDAFTTAVYCERALRALGHQVVVAGRDQPLEADESSTAAELCDRAASLLGGEVDLLLVVEGATFVPAGVREAPCRTALWAIANHLHADPAFDQTHLQLARPFDHVFVAQRDYVAAFQGHGLDATWLPLACEPDSHRQAPQERDLDVVFVGNVLPIHARRRRLLDRLHARFAVVERQGVYGAAMAALFARARIVFNCSLRGDLNMRVFEALASGALLVTDRTSNGQDVLFADGEHLALYDGQAVAEDARDGRSAPDEDGLERVVTRWLNDEAGRTRVSARGQRLVTAHHTYAHRMAALVERVMSAPLSARVPAAQEVRS